MVGLSCRTSVKRISSYCIPTQRHIPHFAVKRVERTKYPSSRDLFWNRRSRANCCHQPTIKWTKMNRQPRRKSNENTPATTSDLLRYHHRQCRLVYHSRFQLGYRKLRQGLTLDLCLRLLGESLWSRAIYRIGRMWPPNRHAVPLPHPGIFSRST